MHRQLQDMVEGPKIAEIPSTDEGTCGKLFNLFYMIMHYTALRFTDGK